MNLQPRMGLNNNSQPIFNPCGVGYCLFWAPPDAPAATDIEALWASAIQVLLLPVEGLQD